MNKSIHSYDAAIRQRLDRSLSVRRGWLSVGLTLIILFVFSSFGVAATADHGQDGVVAASVMAPLCLAGGVLRKEDDGPGGGGAHDDDEYAQKILKSIKDIKLQVDKVERECAEHSETKKQVEELHKSIKTFDGLAGDVKTFFEKQKQLDERLANIRREVNGDPLKRIVEDEEMRSLLLAPARGAFLRAKGREVSKEIAQAEQRMSDIISGKALTGAATPGSIVINQELVKAIYQLVAMYGRWADFDILRPSARTVKIPVDTSDPTAVWATEGAAPSEGSYAGSQVTLDIKKILVWIGVSNDLLEDDEIGLASHLMNKFARAIAKKLDHACFVADGTDDATHGNFEGIFEFGTAYDLPATKDTIAELDLSHFTGLVAGADEALTESANSRWWGHGQILVQMLNVKDSNGRPIFLTALEAPAAGGVGSILGYTFTKSNLCPKTVAAEAPFLAFGDPMGLAVAVRTDMEVATSDQVKFTEDQTVFRGRMRAGTKIKQATAFEVMTFGTAS